MFNINQIKNDKIIYQCDKSLVRRRTRTDHIIMPTY